MFSKKQIDALFGFYKLNPIRQKREVKDNKTITTLDLNGFSNLGMRPSFIWSTLGK